MTEARWELRNRFKGFGAAHSVFARTVDLAGRCLIGRLGDRMASGSQPPKESHSEVFLLQQRCSAEMEAEQRRSVEMAAEML